MSRPHVTLKLATSMDGQIALSNGISQWITGAEARARVHQMRAQHDAVLVGIGTVLADDPLLTVRTVPPPPQQPVRIVADSRLRTPLDGRLILSAGLGKVVLAWHGDQSDLDARPGAYQAAGDGNVETWRVGGVDRRVDPGALLKRCEVEGIASIFLEGGGQLAASFMKAGLVDTLQWFRAPILIGGDGRAAIADLGITAMDAAPRWHTAATERIGDDVLETYVRR
ncbi:MAG: RibD family protein [Pseudomonadota bacterium]